MILGSILIFFFTLFVFNGSRYVSKRDSQDQKQKTPRDNNCLSDYDGQVGVCQKFSQCPTAQSVYYTAGITPIYCDHNQEDPIVCCILIPNEDGAPIQVIDIIPQKLKEIETPYFFPSADEERAMSTFQLQECQLNSSRKIGFCRRLSNCPESQTAISERKPAPVYCQNDRDDPVICCDVVPVLQPRNED